MFLKTLALLRHQSINKFQRPPDVFEAKEERSFIKLLFHNLLRKENIIRKDSNQNFKPVNIFTMDRLHYLVLNGWIQDKRGAISMCLSYPQWEPG